MSKNKENQYGRSSMYKKTSWPYRSGSRESKDNNSSRTSNLERERDTEEIQKKLCELHSLFSFQTVVLIDLEFSNRWTGKYTSKFDAHTQSYKYGTNLQFVLLLARHSVAVFCLFLFCFFCFFQVV